MAGSSDASFGTARKLSSAKAREFAIVDNFKYGYRNREDVTNLPPGVLIVGSQNVLTNVSERVQIRQGYSLDGLVSMLAAPVLASFDFLTRGNGEVHLRAGGLTSAGNDGKMQYRYVAGDGTVTWRDLLTGLSSVAFNFTTFWRTDESLRVALFVNGQSEIQEWNGATATLASSDNIAGHVATVDATPTNGGTGYAVGNILTITTGGTNGKVQVLTVDGSGAVLTVALTQIGSGYSTGTGKATSGGSGTSATIHITAVATGQIVISGTTGVADSGFYVSSDQNLIINGNTYAYTNVFGNSFLGISPDATGEAVDSVIINAVITTPNAAMSGITATFQNGLIATMNNQVFLGALNSSVMWLSKVNDYTDYTSSTPRQVGEGGSLVLDENLVAFVVQGNPTSPTMYISGTDVWYTVTFTDFTNVDSSSGQTLGAVAIKTGKQQGAQSQAMVSSMKNNTILVSGEPTIDQIGVMENYFTQIQTKNISDPIKLDVDSYDFTDASIFYFKYFIYVAVPKNGVVRVYNLVTNSWEAPQTLPISRFYIVDGDLYGHSYSTFESYKLFTGYADRVYPGFSGFPIAANWVFSYENYGSRFTYKKANAFYVEGYINPNTTLTVTLNYELDGCKTSRTMTLSGNNQQFVCLSAAEGSLGKTSLGKIKLGGDMTPSIQGLPPKFRWIPTFTNKDFFEVNFEFSVLGVNERMELLAFGLNAAGSSQEPVQNKD